ncbi:MAG: hypothetical protein ACYC39_10745 [Thiobacillus sp.]
MTLPLTGAVLGATLKEGAFPGNRHVSNGRETRHHLRAIVTEQFLNNLNERKTR